MNYIDKLETKREMLRDEVLFKEIKFSNAYNSLFNKFQEDMIERLIQKLSLITTFAKGIRVGISFLNTFLGKK